MKTLHGTAAAAICFVLITATATTGITAAQTAELPLGAIVDRVQCQADPSQTYSLYLPSSYSPSRQWSVIFAFDAGGRGRRAVERYQAAAEKYGYIIAASDNSKNGPWDVSLNAAKAMTEDVRKRFSINPKRLYTAGMSGGSRVAMKVALDSTAFDLPTLAGVFASSAAFPDEFHNSVAFPVFGTAGSDDFNHMEMAELDEHLASAHRVEYFDGGHTWLPVELAMDGVEWMELQAMKGGARPRDAKLIDEIFEHRVGRAGVLTPAETVRELRTIVSDFQGLEDVSKVSEQAKTLERRVDVKDALKAEMAARGNELRLTSEVYQLRDRANDDSNFARLKELLLKLNDLSKTPADTNDRRVARRILGGFLASSRGASSPELQQLLNQLRPVTGAPGGEAAPR